MLNEEELKRLHDKMYEQETLDALAKVMEFVDNIFTMNFMHGWDYTECQAIYCELFAKLWRKENNVK